MLATQLSDLPADIDAIVVGAGAAGLYAALCLPPELQVVIISKEALQVGASDWAQGGIAAAVGSDDSPQLHWDDTLQAGAGLCDPEAVRFLVDHASDSIEHLIRLGVEFDRHHGQLAMTLEAAHSRPRVLHAADTTGRAIVATLTERVLARPNILAIPQALVLELWQEPHLGQVPTRCRGVSLLWQEQMLWLEARAIVLATGGGGQVFAHTTNPAVSTGDGVALAWRAGALLQDLEFVQFHPTALSVSGAPRFLISEAVRGEGAHLIDARGDRFAFAYHSDGELAPRDVVSRAIYTHLQKTAPDPAEARAFLDLRVIAPERLRRRFPNIIRNCLRWGVDPQSEPIPVAPAAHYWMGGVAVDLECQTSVPGLYAVGEVACTGVHGANRLASNSLLECLVFGAQLQHIEFGREATGRSIAIAPSADPIAPWPERDSDRAAAIRQQLPVLVWDSAGICRNGRDLARALANVAAWQNECTEMAIGRFFDELAPQLARRLVPTAACQLRAYTETRNLLDAAYLILKSAVFRTESRGGHFRTDYARVDPTWAARVFVRGKEWHRER
ncbi:L-aspartate oxidase [Rubidibacter lacunae]|uniref:L-aspartate oxidase n=1 Tax=Rubidibacter lacunae TaxID=582514 RepID=UPI000688FE59|nr:L-aspartate oxidase [Rubidibacter lacunae]